MCGIAGFVGQGTTADLRRMNDSLAHRGPDDAGVWVDERRGVFLGHRRLSIVDLGGGHQPMWTADGDLGVVFNGEIYNHLDLRKELIAHGCVFQTDHSDTEVLLQGYRHWGPEFTARLNGMWAFVLYDRKTHTLFCSRDRFGKKPLYYTLQGGTFVFASELSAVTRHPAVRARLSTRSLQKYFAYGYIPSPSSVYEGIHKLPGGHSLTFEVSSGRFSIARYWEFVIEPFERIPADPEREWGEQLVELLSRAVQRRLMSDVPLGFFLSGGIDSSSVVALATRHVDRSRINTFSIGFEEPTFDESQYSSEVAQALGTNHNLDVLSLEKAHALLPDIVTKLDEPMGDSSLLPTYLLCKHTRAKVTVALGGDGADELFAGYDPFRALRAAELYGRWMPQPVHQAIRLAMSWLPVSHAITLFTGAGGDAGGARMFVVQGGRPAGAGCPRVLPERHQSTEAQPLAGAAETPRKGPPFSFRDDRAGAASVLERGHRQSPRAVGRRMGPGAEWRTDAHAVPRARPHR
jgi:asparagine synthase (glutamine-hydrolysing)